MASADSTQLDYCSLTAKDDAEEETGKEAGTAASKMVDQTYPNNAVNNCSTATVNKNKKKTKKKNTPRNNKMGTGDGKQVLMPTQKLVDLYFPWTASNRPKVGRCAISVRAIKAGEVVAAERAVAFVPRSKDRLVVCHSCCRSLSPSLPPLQCPGCKYSVFCKDCNEEATERHKIWCRLSGTIGEIAKVSDCDEDLLHLVLELALEHRPTTETAGALMNGDSKAGAVKDGIIYSSYEDALCLETHIDKVTAGWQTSIRKGCQLLYDEAVKGSGSDVNFSAETSQDSQPRHEAEGLAVAFDVLENLAALVNTNSHGMGANGSGIHNTDMSVGIFPFVSMLNHSCRPNCCFASDGRVMYVRAVQDIPRGTELCLSYINLYEPRGVRQMQLAITKHFLCRCQRCSEPFASSIDRFLEGCLCTVRGCGGVIVKASSLHEVESTVSGSSLLSTWECDQCSRIFYPNMLGCATQSSVVGAYPGLLVAKAEKKLAEAMNVYKERRFKDARVLLENYIDEFTGRLHPLNVLLFDALTPLMSCCRALGDAAEGSRVCQNILSCMEKVISRFSLELANFYFCLGEMYLERSEGPGSNVITKHRRKLAQESFQRVRMIRKICLGKDTLPGEIPKDTGLTWHK